MTFESLLVSVFYLSIPWIFLEAASRYFTPGRSRLKLRSKRSGLGSTTNKITYGSTSISRGPLWIKLETTYLNEWPSKLLRVLSYKARARRRSNHDLALHLNGNGDSLITHKSDRLHWLELTYQAGTIFAGLALLGSLIFLLWGALDVIGKIVSVEGSSAPTQSFQSSLVKRSEEASQIGTSWSPNLVPLIPGFTIPFNHIYPLVIALSLTQIIHEAGHAICAALYSWTPLHMGLVIIFPCIPGAFVTLPQEALEDQSDNHTESNIRNKFQIVSAGVWHNAVTAFIMTLILYGGIGNLSHSIFWTSASSLVVESVEVSSPLAEHMPPGTLITQIDDLQLNAGTFADREATWRSYLTQEIAKDEKGWCVSRDLWQKKDPACCELLNSSKMQNESNSKGLCFVPKSIQSGEETGRCFDPIRLVSEKTVLKRCKDVCTDSDHICIHPDPREKLIRVTIRRFSDDQSQVVFFQGDSRAVYAAVHLSRYLYRVSTFPPPYALFKWWHLLLSYFLNLSMAMALLNMLPLPSLDGDVYLGLILKIFVSRFDFKSNSEVYDEEAAFEMKLDETSEVSHATIRHNHKNIMPRWNGRGNDQLKMALLVKIQNRFRWFSIFLAIFVFGGSIILHATDPEIAT